MKRISWVRLRGGGKRWRGGGKKGLEGEQGKGK